jgi:hypothetical protein
MKHCPTCKTMKSETDFYRDPRQRDGLKGQCKKCHCAGAVRTRDPDNHRVKRAEQMRRAREANPEKFRERDRAASAKRTKDDRTAARMLLNSAVKTGKVVRAPACEGCGIVGRLHGHHDDYAKPLEVRWLCPPCHGKEHRS